MSVICQVCDEIPQGKPFKKYVAKTKRLFSNGKTQFKPHVYKCEECGQTTIFEPTTNNKKLMINAKRETPRYKGTNLGIGIGILLGLAIQMIINLIF